MTQRNPLTIISTSDRILIDTLVHLSMAMSLATRAAHGYQGRDTATRSTLDANLEAARRSCDSAEERLVQRLALVYPQGKGDQAITPVEKLVTCACAYEIAHSQTRQQGKWALPTRELIWTSARLLRAMEAIATIILTVIP